MLGAINRSGCRVPGNELGVRQRPWSAARNVTSLAHDDHRDAGNGLRDQATQVGIVILEVCTVEQRELGPLASLRNRERGSDVASSHTQRTRHPRETIKERSPICTMGLLPRIKTQRAAWWRPSLSSLDGTPRNPMPGAPGQRGPSWCTKRWNGQSSSPLDAGEGRLVRAANDVVGAPEDVRQVTGSAGQLALIHCEVGGSLPVENLADGNDWHSSAWVLETALQVDRGGAQMESGNGSTPCRRRRWDRGPGR